MGEGCPICAAGMGVVLFLDEDVILLRDGPGLALAPRRHVPRWRDLTEDERTALAARIGAAQDRLETGAAPAKVRLVEGGHVHLRVTPPAAPPLPGGVAELPHDRALIPGGAADALLAHLVAHIDRSDRIDVAVSFLMRSGVRLLLPHLRDLLERGGRLRLVTSDYLDVTEPEALRLLDDLEGARDLRVFRAGHLAFHPKAWIFRVRDGTGAIVAGSSNLSRSALTEGVEWNLRLFGSAEAAPLGQALAEFEGLLAHPAVAPLTDDWIAAYADRRARPDRPAPQVTGVAAEPGEPAPEPHEVQREALAALAASRERGYGAGLVVLATGLGKTYLAAFDSRPFARILFVAHREEILSQAMAAFRAVRPEARLGRFAGAERDPSADIVFASIQTLGRLSTLSAFARDAFDYVVVDEFHHASAATYRRVIDHFEPRFLLGLTATPERMDGGDLLGLCQENLVHRCDLWDGVGRGLLSPFAYFGVPDLVEYAQIPWRSGRFDETALEAAVATEARAANALDQLAARGGRRAIGFCVSRRHADFMAEFARGRGLEAVAVHSGEDSAPRASALKALAAGRLDIVFAVDMFNEGVDVPEIDTVLMLRPTESPVIWLQQLGRGLRRAAGKNRLAVIDYIGNHRSFLAKARMLLRAGEGERAVAERLAELRRGDLALPPGCEVTYELEALEILDALIRRPRGRDADELEAVYRDLRLRHGTRPTALEMHHAGFDPRRTGHGGWLGFVAHMGDLDTTERRVLATHGALLREIETTSLTRSDKPLVLLAMIEAGAFPGEIATRHLAERVARRMARDPRLAAEFGEGAGDPGKVERPLTRHALPAWTEAGGGRWFRRSPGLFATTFDAPPEDAEALRRLAGELAEWRLAKHLGDPAAQGPDYAPPEATPVAEAAEPPDRPAPDGPVLWLEYARERIPPLFGASFNPGSWNAGIVTVPQTRAMILLVTLQKGALSAGNHYVDRFESPDRFVWQTQTSTRRESRRGRILSGAEPGWTVHLFVRGAKLRDGRAAPFRYCGPVGFVSWEGEAPITVHWRLPEPVPEHLRSILIGG